MTACVALIRGINVGRARRIAMAELRELCTDEGWADVRTLLNSGNVVFRVARPDTIRLARAAERAIAARFGFDAPVVVVTDRELAAVVAANPLAEVADDPSRLLVAFFAGPGALETVRPLLDRAWAPESMALAADAAHLWCPAGIIASPLAKEFGRLTQETATTRNWATVLKLQAALGPLRS